MKKENFATRTEKTVAIIPAAGSGIRMGTDCAKQFLDLNGKPLLALTLKPFQKCRAIETIIVVVPSKDVAYCRTEIVEKFQLFKVKTVVAGGRRRQDSVRMGLEASGKDSELVLIHDGVRPIITEEAIEHIIDSAKIHRAVITGLPAWETVKEVDNNRKVINTCDRKRLWLIQTPQIFRYEDIWKAHQMAFQENWGDVTDDAALIEKLGIPVKVIEGSENNIKVTNPNDLALTRFLLASAHP